MLPILQSRAHQYSSQTIAPFNDSVCRISNVSQRSLQRVYSSSVIFGRSELDSHAETTALGKNSIILSFTGRECEVSPYADSYDIIKKVPIVTGATGYTSPISGKRLILIFNESLWLGDHMQHTLLNHNQLLSFGMLVKDDPFASDEPIYIESENGDAILPLHTEGTIIYLDTWTPTDEDLSQFHHIIMTSPHPWNPSKVQFPKNSLRVEEELTIRSIASATTDHGMSTIKLMICLTDRIFFISSDNFLTECFQVFVY